MSAPETALDVQEVAAGPALQVPVETAQQVLNYLIFHRSLIDDTAQAAGRNAVLERYLSLVKDLREGVHVVIADPLQKATALLFELVLGEQFDPWEIDLVRFTQAYLERIRNEADFDFAVSGRLVYMAWSILHLQSQELLQHREEFATAPPTELDAAGLPVDLVSEPMDEGYLGELNTAEAVQVTSSVLEASVPTGLEEMIRHSETRPVSLLELVNAFGEAEAEARRSLHIEELRERLREQQRAPPEVLVHGDVPERDLVDAWEACSRHAKGEAFPFLGLWRASEGRDRLVALFLATLFLARENVLELHQERLTETPIELTRIADQRPERVKEE
jgi:segregation and condensation protein A